MTLIPFGWDARRQAAFTASTADGLVPGRVVGEHRTHYQVAIGEIELTAQAMGKLRNDSALRSDLPGVGDFVALRPSLSDGPATIEAVLPRATALIRKASGKETPQLLAANVDVVFIVTGLDGDFNVARVLRFLDLVGDSGATPVIVANKTDVSKDAAAATHQLVEAAPGVALHAISARGGTGVAELERYFDGNRTVVLIGSSGAGKSTMINKLLGDERQVTGEVRGHDSRGRHTTTQRQLFLRPGGGAIIDTPGMRGLELRVEAEPAARDFDDVENLARQCKFSNCRHLSEPGCAVRAAIARGDLAAARLAEYAKK